MGGRFYLAEPARTGTLAVLGEPYLPSACFAEEEIQELLSTSFTEESWAIEVQARTNALLTQQPLEILRTVEKEKQDSAKKQEMEVAFDQEALDSSLVDMVDEFSNQAELLMEGSYKTPAIKKLGKNLLKTEDLAKEDLSPFSDGWAGLSEKIDTNIEQFHDLRVQPKLKYLLESIGAKESSKTDDSLWSGVKALEKKVDDLKTNNNFLESVTSSTFNNKDFQGYMKAVLGSINSVTDRLKKLEVKDLVSRKSRVTESAPSPFAGFMPGGRTDSRIEATPKVSNASADIFSNTILAELRDTVERRLLALEASNPAATSHSVHDGDMIVTFENEVFRSLADVMARICNERGEITISAGMIYDVYTIFDYLRGELFNYPASRTVSMDKMLTMKISMLDTHHIMAACATGLPQFLWTVPLQVPRQLCSIIFHPTLRGDL